MNFPFNKFKKRIIPNLDLEPEPHEVFLNSEKRKRGVSGEEDWEGRLELPVQNSAFKILFWLAIGALLLLFARLGYLQLMRGEDYAELAKVNTEYLRPIHAPRGIMYDRTGKALVANRKTYDIFFDRRIRGEAFTDEEVGLLSDVLGVEREEIAARVDEKAGGPRLLAASIIQDKALRVSSLFGPASGIRVEPNYTREYLAPVILSHVVGYTGFVVKDDLDQYPNLSFQDTIGKSGLELMYDEAIRGENGRTITKVNSKDELLGVTSIKESLPGSDTVLTIDGELQEKMYEAFSKRGLERGAAVALDPRTGEVMALVSVPGFDTNTLSRGIDAGALRKILENPEKPFFNRAVSGQYPPGSTLKPFIALAALQENVINPKKYIYAPAAIFIPNVYNPEIVYRFSDWKEHGYVDMVRAIAVSSNVYFYHLGGGFGEISGLGVEKIIEYLKRFGLGKILGVDIAGEAPGFLPTPEWKRGARGEDWYVGDTYNISIGQGDISLTPLQLASATSAIANGGTLYKPYFVRKITASNTGETVKEYSPAVITSYGVSSGNFDVVQEGMREAVRSGSSRALGDLAVKVAGKTGTAQAGTKKNPHAWWTGFAPYENPEIVLTILVENGGEGSAVAVPIAKEVLEWYFSRK